jgi:tetratricopeptide (TPR) repeat protein
VTDDQSQRAPYPGLRAFRREETDLFFGREDCINAMVDRLAATRFLAVLGSSGTGKSSLVRTGLLDALELGLMAKAGSRWKIVDFRPGGAPLKNLARRLLETEGPEESPSVAPQDVDLLRAYLARGPRAVIEWCRGHLPAGGNLLLLVDQFEELFRYQDYAGREEAEAFVAMLLESAREAEVPIYVTITMRSEYLGACALIEGLSDAINAGMFLTPRMTRDHCRDAIVGPAAVCNIEIEPALVNRLLNDLANFAPWDDKDANDQLDRLMRRADQLPLLQYTLNRMWQRAHDRSGDQRVLLTVADYEAIEGLSGALNAHANQIFEQLGKQRAQVAEWVFRALTAGSTIADAVRRPTRLGDLVSACGGDEDGVRAVVDAFRAPGVNFLVPEFDPNEPTLAPDTYIDISHESLIRQWKKLSDWLEAEGRAAQQWRRLVDRYGTGEMLRGRELANLIAWRGETKPNAAWAKRYGGDYPSVIAYLDKSQRAQNTKRAAMVASIIGAFVLVTGFGIDATVQRLRQKEQSRQLESHGKALEAQLNETDVERSRAEINKRQLVRLVGEVIFKLGPLTAERSATQTTAARRAPETAQSSSPGDPRGGRSTAEVVDADAQPSVDRTTTQIPETQNPAMALAMTALESLRELAQNNADDNEIKRLLTVSLNFLGDVQLQANDIGAAERAYSEGLKLVREMLQTNATPDFMMLWRDDLVLALVGVARVKMRQNNHQGARTDLEEAVAIGRELVKEIVGYIGERDDRVYHNLQIHLGYLGDVYVNLKMRPEARKIFTERLEVRRKRLSFQPGDTQRQSDVSIALDRLGQLSRDDNDLSGARKYFEEALGIDRALYKTDPGRRQWRENLAFSLTRIGDLDRQVNRHAQALRPYEEALELQRKLAAESAATGPTQTLASLLQKIGDIKRRLKQFPAAISSHREELDLRRKLLSRDPSGVVPRRNVSSALDYLGNALRESKDLEGARQAFSEQLEIDRGLAKSRPDDVQSLQDFAWSLNRLGDLDRDTNRNSDAAGHYEAALDIQRRLSARDSDNPVRMRALATILSKLGQVRSRTNDHTTALVLHREELELREKLFKRASARDSDALRDLSLANDRVGNVLRDMNDLPGALKYFEAELALDRSFVVSAPNNVTALGDLQWTLNKVADFVRQRLKDNQAARRYIEEMIGVDRRLLDRQPNNKDRHRRLKDDLTKLAELLLQMNEPAAARDTYGDIFVANERWLGVARENFMKTSNDANRTDLAQAYGDAGWHGLLAGRAKEAMVHIEAALSLAPDATWNTVNLGHAYLFLARYQDAVKLYASVKDTKRTEDGKRLYADEIRDDFALFRRLGVNLPDMARAERELKL